MRVQRGAVATVVSAPARLLAKRESQIGTEVAGPIQQVFVSEGDRVEAGAPLFQIDPLPYEMALRAAQAGYDVAVAERRQARQRSAARADAAPAGRRLRHWTQRCPDQWPVPDESAAVASAARVILAGAAADPSANTEH